MNSVITRRHPWVDVWRPPAGRSRVRPPDPLAPSPTGPPPPLELQLAALEGELRAWGREALT
jgi:hypothetical protein